MEYGEFMALDVYFHEPNIGKTEVVESLGHHRLLLAVRTRMVTLFEGSAAFGSHASRRHPQVRLARTIGKGNLVDSYVGRHNRSYA